MSPEEIRTIRANTGMTQLAFARALGYANPDSYRRYEQGTREVPHLLALLMEMINRHQMPLDWIDDGD